MKLYSTCASKEIKCVEGVNYTREKNEAEKKKQEINENRATIHQQNLQRRTETEIQNRDQIQIPIPSYSYGAVRRSRFAFGRISPLQARINTANQLKNGFEGNLQAEEEPPDETPLPLEEEIFEEDLFRNEEEPNKEDCA